MHGHLSKHVKMQRKPTSGTNKHGKHSIAQSGKGERYARKNWGVECNHITTNPLRASRVAKPRTKEANTSIKHRSKQA